MQKNSLCLLLLMLLGSFPLKAQTELKRVFVPANPVLERYFAREQKDLAKASQENPALYKTQNECPQVETGSYYFLPGEVRFWLIDTAGLDSPTLEIPSDCVGLGLAELQGDTLFYYASPFADGLRDTVCVARCEASGSCDTLVFPTVTRRAGVTIVEPTIDLLAGEVLPEYCVTPFLIGNLNCTDFVDCPDEYAGEGQQSFWLSSPQAGPCIGYQAGQFAGTDTVCLVLCNEFTTCDTFKIPFRIHRDTLGLPFFDDFSYEGPYPDKGLWLDRTVFVNNTLAKNPPSVGMATFDGLDKGGRPYVFSGKADVLTSTYLDLSSPQGDVYLKFYLAPKGYGLLPNPQDSFLVQFRSQTGQWKTVTAVPGIDVPVDSVPPFSFYAIPISSSQYFYRGFQFRFVSFSSPAGLYDLWHLDYVWLDDQSGPEAVFEDLAFTTTPPLLLKTYSAMPLRQFQGFVEEELNVAPMPSSFYNHFNTTATISESAIQLREILTDDPFPGMENVVDGLDANIPPAEHTFRQKELNVATWNNYQAILENDFTEEDKIWLETSYHFTLTSQATPFFRNDTVRSITRLEDYYAYDDGTAEGYVAFSNPQEDNPILAVRFHTHISDTLRAVQFHFPHVNGNVESQLFNLKIWVGELDDEPDYEADFLRPKYADSYYDTLQGFSTYLLQDHFTEELTPLYIPADTDFYVAFQQVSITNQGIPIGMDFQRNRNEEFFVNISDSWEAFPVELTGSLMIRALMNGEDTLFNTATSEAKKDRKIHFFSLYPNPVSSETGQIVLLSQHARQPGTIAYRLTTLTGQVLAEGNFSFSGEEKIRYTLPLPHLPKGFYGLTLHENGLPLQTLKLIVH